MDIALFVSTAIPTFMTFAPSRLLVVTGYVFIVVALVHAFRYLRKPATFVASSFVVGLASELIGATTGFPHGPFRYVAPSLGFMVFDVVPLTIPFLWFALGYFAYHVGVAITSSWKWMPIAAWMLVSLDVMIDPVASGRLWVWLKPGEVYGVPITNFLGWFMVALTFYLIYHSANGPPGRASLSAIITFTMISSALLVHSLILGMWTTGVAGFTSVLVVSAYAVKKMTT